MSRYLVKEFNETSLNLNKAIKERKNNINDKITLQELEDFLVEGSELELYAELMVKYWADGTKLERLDNSGNNYCPEINFKPCYVGSSTDVKHIIHKGLQKRPELEEKYPAVERLENSNRIPLPCLIECCDLNRLNLWKALKGETLGSKTSSKQVVIPKRTAKLDELLVWIKNEGHIPLSHPSIEINQIVSESTSLDYLSDLTSDIYGESSLCNFSKTDCWSGENGKRMIISSSAVRQLMVLRHGIPMGKKSRHINWNRKVTERNYPRILSAMIQTEGSISESKGQARFEFKIQDKCIRDICHRCLQILGCSPSKTSGRTFNTGIFNIEDMIKLYYFMRNHIGDAKITRKTKRKISDSNILISLKKKHWCEGIDSARNKLEDRKPNQRFTELHNQIFNEVKINHSNVSSWALGKAPARFSAALIAAKVLDDGFQKMFNEPLQIYISSTSLDQYVGSKPQTIRN